MDSLSPQPRRGVHNYVITIPSKWLLIKHSAENASSTLFSSGLTVCDILTGHLERHSGFIPGIFHVALALGICEYPSFQELLFCRTARGPHEQTQGLVAHLFPLQGFPV